MNVLLVGALLLPAWAAAASPPHLCLSDPPMALDAGSSVALVVLDGGPVGRPCKAMLSFADPDFLPVSYYFDPLPCPGRYLASFLVPAGAPNGDAFVTWWVDATPSPTSVVALTQKQAMRRAAAVVQPRPHQRWIS
ncbi:uncharacterized protein PG986_014481 [Apiospora aurea]|uniref:Uncharacterized protein n=1 Tax=Apiospora aurea TaxID=335848 RepID=A0ABR1PTF6_9PEZI